MIRALMVGVRGQPLVMLGLSADNLERLRNDEPIHLELRHLSGTDEVHRDLPDVDLIIAFDDGTLTEKLLQIPPQGAS